MKVGSEPNSEIVVAVEIHKCKRIQNLTLKRAPWLDIPIQSCMTLTDIRLTEYMGLKEKGATTELSI